MKSSLIRSAVVAGAIAIILAGATPANAIHLFPLFPGDPTGDCAAKLQAAPKRPSAATVNTDAFFFYDSAGSSSTAIKRGQAVTWVWNLAHCHSVTTTSVPKGARHFTTRGGPPANERELVKPSEGRNTFTVKLTVPGTYQYVCVHHADVGMTGTVVVTR